jgi:hypothetical protein
MRSNGQPRDARHVGPERKKAAVPGRLPVPDEVQPYSAETVLPASHLYTAKLCEVRSPVSP